jgi:branched-chain amino acid transport system permease protein
VVILAIGGRQTLWGAVVGAAFLTIVPEFLRQGAERYALLIYGIMLTIVFMYLPGGLVGVARSALERVATWRTATSSD